MWPYGQGKDKILTANKKDPFFFWIAHTCLNIEQLIIVLIK